MRRRTTTKQLNTAITNNLLTIEKAETYSKTTHQTDQISADQFKDSLDFLCETIFAPCIGWYFEKHKTGNYEIDCSRMNPNTDLIVIAHLRANDNVDSEDIDKALRMIEEE